MPRCAGILRARHSWNAAETDTAVQGSAPQRAGACRPRLEATHQTKRVHVRGSLACARLTRPRTAVVRRSFSQSAAPSGESSVQGGLALSARNCGHGMRDPLPVQCVRTPQLRGAPLGPSVPVGSGGHRRIQLATRTGALVWEHRQGRQPLLWANREYYDPEPDLLKRDLDVARNYCPRVPGPVSHGSFSESLSSLTPHPILAPFVEVTSLIPLGRIIVIQATVNS